MLLQGILESKKRSHRGYGTRLKRYFCNLWNWWDIISYVLLILALFVRHFYIDETFTIARRLFALSLLVMYPKFLGVFLMFRKIGLTIIMIKEMVKLFNSQRKVLGPIFRPTVLKITNYTGLLITEVLWIWSL